MLAISGLGGLLYGIDVGIIGGAYPYLAATSNLTAGQRGLQSVGDDALPVVAQGPRRRYDARRDGLPRLHRQVAVSD